MMEYFRQRPVSLIVWNERTEATLKAHECSMSEMLRSYPLSWHRVLPADSGSGSAATWAIYEYRHW